MKEIRHFWSENHDYIMVGLIVILSVVLSSVLRRVLKKYFYTTSDTLHLDRTRYAFFLNVLSFFIYSGAFTFILFYIPELRTTAYTLFAGAGIFAAIIGFASQQAFANIISGIFIVISKPFNVGDWIRVGEHGPGQVEDITLRHTVLKDFKNNRIVLPNSIINNQVVINETLNDEKVCEFIEMSVPLGTEIAKAMRLMQAECMAHPLSIDNRSLEEIAAGLPEVEVRLVKIGESALLLRAYVWTTSSLKAYTLRYELYERILLRFGQEGIHPPTQVIQLLNR